MELIAECVRWLDGIDVVVLDAVTGGGFGHELACEHVLVGHGRIRRLLGAAVVGAVTK